MTYPKTYLSVAAALVLSLAAAGCGSSSSSSSTSTASSTAAATTSAAKMMPAGTEAATNVGGVEVLHLTSPASGAIKYSMTNLTAKAGKVKIIYANLGPTQHNLSLTDSKGNELGAEQDPFAKGVRTTSVTLKPGVYKFQCQVPGHAAAGMKGTLTVS